MATNADVNVIQRKVASGAIVPAALKRIETGIRSSTGFVKADTEESASGGIVSVKEGFKFATSIDPSDLNGLTTSSSGYVTTDGTKFSVSEGTGSGSAEIADNTLTPVKLKTVSSTAHGVLTVSDNRFTANSLGYFNRTYVFGLGTPTAEVTGIDTGAQEISGSGYCEGSISFSSIWYLETTGMNILRFTVSYSGQGGIVAFLPSYFEITAADTSTTVDNPYKYGFDGTAYGFFFWDEVTSTVTASQLSLDIISFKMSSD